jgi:small GTP-binding protein
MKDDMPEPVAKILVVGDTKTGKTSIIERIVHNRFSSEYKRTYQVEFVNKVVKIGDNNLKLEFFDIAGQESDRIVTKPYVFPTAIGAFVVADAGREDTFIGAGKWKKDIDSKCSIPVILLINKIDIDDIKINYKLYNEIWGDYGFV